MSLQKSKYTENINIIAQKFPQHLSNQNLYYNNFLSRICMG